MASLKEYQSMGAAPSVSNEQWKKYALKKLSSGYLLIISKTRNIARFYKGDNALENCSFRVAKRLLSQGYLEEIGTHITGTVYQLSEMHEAQEVLAKISKSKLGVVQVMDDEDFEDESDSIGYDLEEELTEDTIETQDEEGDQNSTVI